MNPSEKAVYLTFDDGPIPEVTPWVLDLLDKYGVDAYICGHIHNFQHIQAAGSKVQYFVNSSGSLARDVKPIDGTQFCSSDEGFMVLSTADNLMRFFLVNYKGEIIYQYDIKK